MSSERRQLLLPPDIPTLLTSNRLDVFSRFPLALALSQGFESSWCNHAYQQMLIHSRPRLDFSEDGKKFNISDYLFEFRSLHQSFTAHGTLDLSPAVQVSPNGLLNGAHRIALAVAMQLPLYIDFTTIAERHTYDYEYLQRIGVPSYIRNEFLEMYVRSNSKIRAFLLINLDAQVRRNIRARLKDEVLVIATIDRALSETGIRRLMKIAYGQNDWWRDSYMESMVAERKTRVPLNASLVIVESSDAMRLSELKSDLRSVLDSEVFERCVHSTDDHSDTVELMEAFGNSNTWSYVNSAPIGAELRVVSELQLVGHAQSGTSKPTINRIFGGFSLIDGSSTLEVHGVRTARDYDGIYIPNLDTLPPGVNDHSEEYSLLPMSVFDLILDPRLHFRIKQQRFIALSALMYFKSLRSETKDQSDLVSLASLNLPQSNWESQKVLALKSRYWRGRIVLAELVARWLLILPERQRATVLRFLRKLANYL